MPEFDKLSKYVDKAALQLDTAFIISEFKKVEDEALKMAQILADSTTKLGGGGLGMKASIDEINKLTTAGDTYNKGLKAQTENITQLAKVRKQVTAEEIAGIEKTVDARRKLINENERLKKGIKEVTELYKKEVFTSEEATSSINKKLVAIERNKAKISELNKVINEQTSLSQTLTKEQKLQNAVLETERNSLGRAQALIKQYTFEKSKLNLSTVEGTRLNDSYNKAIAKTNDFILKNADAETVRSKSVGKYTEGIQKAFSGLRTLANILPGVGLSGIFLAAFEAIKYVVEELGILNSKLFDTTAKARLITQLNSEAAQNAGKEAASLKIIKAEIESANIPMDTRLQLIKNIKEEYPEYFKGLTNEQILNGNVAGAYDLAAAAILRKAKANAAASEIEKLSSANLAIELKQQQEAVKAADELNKAKAYQKTIAGSGGTVGGIGQSISISKAQAEAEIVDRLKRNQKADKEDLRLNNEKVQFLLKFAIQGANETVKIDKAMVEKKKEINAAEKQSLKEKFDADFENYKRDQARKIQLLDEDLANDKNSFVKRIQLLNEFSTEKVNLQKVITAKEIENEDEKLRVLQANLKVSKGTDRNNILAEIENTNARKKDLENKLSDDIALILIDNEKRFNEITKQEAENYKKIQKDKYESTLKNIEGFYNDQKRLNDTSYADSLESLEQQRKDGDLSEKDYIKKRLKLDTGYAIQSLQIEIDKQKKIIALRAALGQDVRAEMRALAKVELDLAKMVAKFNEDILSESQKRTLKGLENVKKYSEVVFDLLRGVFNAQEIAEKNRLRDQQDAAEKKAAKDIELINATTASEEEKAAKIAIVNARLAAQKEEFARKERQAEINKLKFEKAASIFRITIETAIAVAKAGFITPTALLAGILGAAQLAIAIATPIPRFKHGLNKDYEGMAVVGDGGKKEVIKRKDGSIEITPDTDTLTYINKGDRVLPDADLFLKQLQHDAIKDTARVANGKTVTQSGYGKAMIDAMNRQTDVLNKIESKPVQTIHGTEQGLVALLHYGSNQISYINDNINF